MVSSGQRLFGAIPISTQSGEARKFIELAWDKYENSMFDDAVVNARHATEKDPWGMEYTKQNTAGSGAYRVVNWTAGTEVVMERNDKWAGGPMPKVRRIVWRMVPSSGNRRRRGSSWRTPDLMSCSSTSSCRTVTASRCWASCRRSSGPLWQ